jgi:hypothetical protein
VAFPNFKAWSSLDADLGDVRQAYAVTEKPATWRCPRGARLRGGQVARSEKWRSGGGSARRRLA